LNAQWSEIDWQGKVWVIPATRMKASKEHRIPLSDRAMEILVYRRQYPIDSSYVFTSYGPGAMTQKSMICVLRNMDIPVTVHGFRSSFRNWTGAATTFQREIIEQCLAHTVNGVEGAYWRDDSLAERRDIMAAWSAYCEGQS
jgi:integrase